MNILVCMKQVPDTTEVKLDPVKGTLIREGVPSIMNPDDKAALEEALVLKDKYNAHVTCITMGLPQAKAILIEAMAMGADDGILLTDRKLGGADTLATSLSLSYAIKALMSTSPVDLIIGGRQAIDGDTAQVGPQIAEHLGLPQISYAKEIKLSKDQKTVTVKRLVEDGYYVLEAQLPCLVTVLSEANKPRYMHVNRIVDAEKFEESIKVWGVDDLKNMGVKVDEARLGLTGSPTNVYKSFPKQLKPAGEVFTLDTEDAVKKIVEKLKERHFI